jgi:hypothetical protein
MGLMRGASCASDGPGNPSQNGANNKSPATTRKLISFRCRATRLEKFPYFFERRNRQELTRLVFAGNSLARLGRLKIPTLRDSCQTMCVWQDAAIGRQTQPKAYSGGLYKDRRASNGWRAREDHTGGEPVKIILLVLALVLIRAAPKRL